MKAELSAGRVCEGGKACRRKTGARNVGVCRFGSGGGEERATLVEGKDKKSTGPSPEQEGLQLGLTDSGLRG